MRPLWILALAVSTAHAQPTAFEWTELTQQLGLDSVLIPAAGFAIADVDGDGDNDLIVADGAPNRPPALWLRRSRPAGFVPRQVGLPNGVGASVCAAPAAFDGPLKIFAAGSEGLRSDTLLLAGDFLRCRPAPPGEDGSPRLLLLRRDAALSVGTESLAVVRDLPLPGCAARDVLWLPGGGILAACAAGPDLHFVNGEERGGWLGTAYDARGFPQRTAALAAGDVDGDGLFDVVKLVEGDLPAIYLQAPDGGFEAAPAALATGAAEAALLADLDLDGRLDLVIAQARRIALFRNAGGGGRFTPAGGIEQADVVALAFADLDGDRRPELITLSADGALRAFVMARAGAFLTLRLEPAAAAIGAEVTVESGPSRQSQTVRQPLELYFGLDRAQSVDRLRIVWPGGRSQLALGLAGERAYVLRRGAPPEALPR
jgi:hypothetical protein